jgi:malonate transporter
VLVVEKVLPFFLIMIVGAVMARTKLLDETGVLGLSRYVYWIGFPTLLIRGLGNAHPPSPEVLKGLLGYGVAALIPFFLASLIARAARWSTNVRAALPMCAALGNTGFLGLPLVASLLSPTAAGWAAAIVAIDWVVTATLAGMALHPATPKGQAVQSQGAAGVFKALAYGLLNPIVAGAVIGVAQMLVGWRWPAPVDQTISMCALSATAVGLVALGATLAVRRAPDQPKHQGAPIWTAVGLKLLVGPACVAAVVTLIGAPPAFRTAAILMAACPTAVTVFVQARSAGVFAEGSARVVAISTLVSAATLTALAALLTG